MSKIPYYLYIFYHNIYKMRIPLLPKLFMLINRIVFGAYIPASCEIGKGSKFAYGGSGVVVHARAKLGQNCTIGLCSTVGGRSKIYNVPVLGDNVYVGGGAKVLGDIRIGSNVVIGANSVVLKSVPDNCVVAGIPAKIIRENVDPKDFV